MDQRTPDSDSTTPNLESKLYQQVTNSTMESGIQGVDGNDNVQIQGNQNWIIKNLSILVNRETLSQGQFNRRKFYVLVLIIVSLGLFYAIAFYLLKQPKPEAVITLQNPQNPIPNNNIKISYNISKKHHKLSPQKSSPDVFVTNKFPGNSGENIFDFSAFTLTYDYKKVDNYIIIKPEIPYLLTLRKGGLISGIDYNWSPFNWQFPELSVKVVNNSNKTLLLSEVAIQVNSSKINLEPVLILKEDHYSGRGDFDLINEGWGRVISPVVNFGITKVEGCNSSELLKAKRNTLRLRDFSVDTTVSIIDYIPSSLLADVSDSDINEGEHYKKDTIVCSFGEISYSTEKGENRVVKFKANVRVGLPLAGMPAPPTYGYDLFLEAGESKYVKYLPISQVIKPGETDNFLVKIATNKSAQFDLTISLKDTSDSNILVRKVLLDVFVPRSQVGRFNNKTLELP